MTGPGARWLPLVGVALLAAGCGYNPLRTVEVQTPLTARPVPVAAPTTPDGSIYHVSTWQPLFEDQHARHVGDALTVLINEKLTASKQATTNANRAGTTTLGLADVTVGSKTVLQGAALDAKSKNVFAGEGDSGANNVFTGTITVTVIEVLSNGYLQVAGEKQIGINTGSEFVRLSGVVNPLYILAGNLVSSSQIADARLEYRGTGSIDEAQTMGWAARALQTLSPF